MQERGRISLEWEDKTPVMTMGGDPVQQCGSAPPLVSDFIAAQLANVREKFGQEKWSTGP